MKPNALQAALLCIALTAALPAGAQMYKWTDDRGVVSYSNTPPPAVSQRKVEEVADRVSVYTTDEETRRAIATERGRDAKASNRERPLEADRNARRPASPNPGMADRQAAAYQRCMTDRRVDCESVRTGQQSSYSDYVYPPDSYVYAPVHVFGARVPQTTRPFFVDPTPPPRVGVSTAPPVGISTAPRVGIDDRPPVGAPPRSRTVGQFR